MRSRPGSVPNLEDLAPQLSRFAKRFFDELFHSHRFTDSFRGGGPEVIAYVRGSHFYPNQVVVDVNLEFDSRSNADYEREGPS